MKCRAVRPYSYALGCYRYYHIRTQRTFIIIHALQLAEIASLRRQAFKGHWLTRDPASIRQGVSIISGLLERRLMIGAPQVPAWDRRLRARQKPITDMSHGLLRMSLMYFAAPSFGGHEVDERQRRICHNCSS
jgi:hypothetical protein